MGALKGKTFAVVLNGKKPNKREMKMVSEAEFIICADGAINFFEGERFPDCLIGDFDSLDDGGDLDATIKVLEEKGVIIMRYPAEKDYTDGDLCVRFVLELESKRAGTVFPEVGIFGAIGGRLDHTLANIGLLGRLERSGVKACIYNGRERIYAVSGSREFKVRRGDSVSLLPFFGAAHILQIDGLQYDLTHYELTPGDTIGISNVAERDEIEIIVGAGTVLVVISR